MLLLSYRAGYGKDRVGREKSSKKEDLWMEEEADLSELGKKK